MFLNKNLNSFFILKSFKYLIYFNLIKILFIKFKQKLKEFLKFSYPLKLTYFIIKFFLKFSLSKKKILKFKKVILKYIAFNIQFFKYFYLKKINEINLNNIIKFIILFFYLPNYFKSQYILNLFNLKRKLFILFLNKKIQIISQFFIKDSLKNLKKTFLKNYIINIKYIKILILFYNFLNTNLFSFLNDLFLIPIFIYLLYLININFKLINFLFLFYFKFFNNFQLILFIKNILSLFLFFFSLNLIFILKQDSFIIFLENLIYICFIIKFFFKVITYKIFIIKFQNIFLFYFLILVKYFLNYYFYFFKIFTYIKYKFNFLKKLKKQLKNYKYIFGYIINK